MGIVGIDLFAGAGGMSLGAAAAGINTVVAVEKDVWAARTYARNHRETRVLNVDVRSVDPNDLIPDVRRACDGVVIFGGPPCRGFSHSNQRTRTFDNPNNWLFRELIRITDSIRPDLVVFENVAGMKDTLGGAFLDKLREDLEALDYSTFIEVLDAAGFGVPQKRQRLFIIGYQGQRKYKSPRPSEVSPTVADAILDLPIVSNGASVCELPYGLPPKSKYSEQLRGETSETCTNNLVTKNSPEVVARYKHIPQGGNWKNIPKRLIGPFRGRGPHTGLYHRLAPDQPARVIGNFRKNMLVHPFFDRGLSVREAARLQSFPDDFVFCGSIGFQQQQVGNAVPPMLATAVFSSVLSALSTTHA